MRILIIGAGGAFRTEASLARAARSLGHEATVHDALGWRRRAGPLAGPWLRWRADAFAPDYVICTRHAIAAGADTLTRLLRGRDSAFWYFDGISPLPPRVIQLARLVARTFATTGYQTDAFATLGLESHFLPQGMDPELDYPVTGFPAEVACDVSFVGSGQYRRRYRLLERMAQRFRLQVRGPGWEGAPPALAIRGGRVDGVAFLEVVRGAAISLGIDALEEQRRERRGGTSNRLWKVLGAAGLYLGEYVPGVEEFARDGVHAVWYRSTEDAMAQAESLLGDPERRARIAAAGRAHVLAHHTCRHRLELLLARQGYTST
jgi:glycosyl transferase family 1